MKRHFDIVRHKTLLVIFIDQFQSTSIFKRTYDNLNQLYNDYDSFQEDDLIDSFEFLKKSFEWTCVILENECVSAI